MSIDPTSEIDDFFVFLRVLALLDRKKSMREIARDIKVSVGTVSNLLTRIEQRFPGPKLFKRGVGGGGGTILTDAGSKLLRSVLDHAKSLRGQPSRLMVACSLSLITNQVVGPVISTFLQKKPEVRFGLRLRTELRFPEMIAQLQEQEIDLAIAWGVAQRQRDFAEVDSEVLVKHPFDLVVVSHDASLIDVVDSIIDDADLKPQSRLPDELKVQLRSVLSGRRSATLGSDAQPYAELFPQILSITSTECIQVDTYDAALAVLTAKAADAAVVPAFYPTLLRLRELGQLYFSRPFATLPLILLYPKGRGVDEAARALIAELEERLSAITHAPSTVVMAERLPEELAEYMRLRFGYYIDGTRSRGGSALSPPFSWRWETISWHGEQDGKLLGMVRNVEGDSFDVIVTKQHPGMLVIATKQKSPRSRSAPNFVSTFTLHTSNPFRVFGVWTTTDTDAARVFATIWSQDRLELEDLMRLQQVVHYRSFLSSEIEVGFDRQPHR